MWARSLQLNQWCGFDPQVLPQKKLLTVNLDDKKTSNFPFV